MTNSTTQKPSVFFWIIASIGVIWNAMGVNQYLQQAYQTDAFKAMYPDESVLEMVLNTPGWVMGAFAIAVFFGFIASVLLILRKKWATPLYLISLIGIVVQMIYNVFISKAMEVYGPGFIIMPIMILIIGVFIYFYSKKATAKGWIS